MRSSRARGTRDGRGRRRDILELAPDGLGRKGESHSLPSLLHSLRPASILPFSHHPMPPYFFSPTTPPPYLAVSSISHLSSVGRIGDTTNILTWPPPTLILLCGGESMYIYDGNLISTWRKTIHTLQVHACSFPLH